MGLFLWPSFSSSKMSPTPIFSLIIFDEGDESSLFCIEVNVFKSTLF